MVLFVKFPLNSYYDAIGRVAHKAALVSNFDVGDLLEFEPYEYLSGLS